MSKDNRDNFTGKVIEIIASRVGYKCSNPSCRCETRGPHTNSSKKVSIGEAAHITAAAPGGPRYDKNLTEDQRKSADNGIWLCRTHARLIDTDPENYPVELLRKWKSKAEDEQYCSINNCKPNAITNNEDYNKALKKMYKKIKKINLEYNKLKLYYDENFSSCNNFVEVNNEIQLRWSLYREQLSEAVNEINNCNYKFYKCYLDYELDFPQELADAISLYFKLTIFTYESDGDVGLYNNYYECLFKMICNNSENLERLASKIMTLIKQEYNK